MEEERVFPWGGGGFRAWLARVLVVDESLSLRANQSEPTPFR